ncbi:PQQ-dependent sugar dehydrogenase [Dyadobacter chenhuakuii]|uniref:PQQ-dependent sugar dehydrogenase n=1 Tax=Dyadobacter chenhuakuii TaxID=2909339 RepID=A0ABY4XQ82_9BACT|nr:PQQ-dependent sugar dehydrogenase [Dyadobacter chenhuakuii]MCF2493153.1 PQQ-dependent sugar dehydrogenase [Dyadobacter chenhuakuii]USJ32563.1 PQQ-dependent sugar dehydrogenase [Dyadobacter chenhuakuii]
MTNLSPRLRRISRVLKNTAQIPAFLLIAAFTIQDSPPKPDESRFTPIVVAENLDEPMVFEVLPDGSAYIIERKGALKKYNASTQSTDLIAMIPVNTKYVSAEGVSREAEEGLMGFTMDPNFEKNHWIYLYYAHPTEKKHILSRYELRDDKLIESSKKDVIEVVTQREVCCHTGGGMTWDKGGNLYLTVGNNTGNQKAAQTDEREGRASWDDQGHAGNTNDLRGKILKIHPEPDGSYTIPEGNLYPKGTAKTRPEIYSMGHRNPWRIAVDSKTGFLYWGEVGPDASEDSEIGPRGYDELNQARKPGNFGWPWFVGDDQAFPVYDYAANKPLAKKDPKNLVNNSPNNTGLKELLPTAPSFIYYPYGISEKFPAVGSGSRSATGGPIYHRADFKSPKRPWPAYYENKWIAADFSRGWIMAISMSPNGDYESMERVLPAYHPVQPIDIKFGPNGDLYVLEYGSNWFRKSENSRLIRIEYNGGNRKPIVQVSTDKKGGTVPFQAKLSSAGTKDFDGDKLKYSWKITGNGGAAKTFATAEPTVTFDKPGVYTASLTVTDAKGASNSQSLRIIAGNEPPKVSVNVDGNKTFFFAGKPIPYSIDVTDKEDGSLLEGKIKPEEIAVSIDYASEGFDYAEVIQSQRSVDASTQFAVAQVLIGKSDCKVCHQVDAKSVGPSFADISNKYKGKPGVTEALVGKILKGGAGVWGEVAMPAHPALPVADAETIVKYILNSTDKTLSTLPVKGEFTPKIPAQDNGKGSVLIRAAFTDRSMSGNKAIPAQTTEEMIVLRSPELNAAEAPIVQGADMKALGTAGLGFSVVTFANSFLAFKETDLTDIKALEMNAAAQKREGAMGGKIEIRLDSPTGTLVGEQNVEIAPEVDMAKLMAELESQKKPGETVKPPRRPTRAPVLVNIKPTTGKHDIYILFKNETAKPIEPLMTLSKITFKQ